MSAEEDRAVSREDEDAPVEYAVPASVRAELLQLRAERSVLMAERERLLGRLRGADAELREALRVQERLVEDARANDELRRQVDEASEARVELDALRRDRDLARQELERTRLERDQLRMDLLQAELTLHGADLPELVPTDDRDAEQLRRQVAELAQELEAHRQTISWRVTAPLRTVRRKTR
ncbi:hypothetical protein ACIRSS_33120 [Amycolatopsis sp. NPDC101161]|jgi:chromosome segregation ATPase|uniref:hypothetical protein n=1 Tax=Amycolatopsis sp. NPDC101161 TaxID=3363940 RepID=UPI003812B790